jgi:hypothetical protein
MAKTALPHPSVLEIALRALKAASFARRPAREDEAYLREIAGDNTTAIDELACQIIERELRLPKRAAKG